MTAQLRNTHTRLSHTNQRSISLSLLMYSFGLVTRILSAASLGLLRNASHFSLSGGKKSDSLCFFVYCGVNLHVSLRPELSDTGCSLSRGCPLCRISLLVSPLNIGRRGLLLSTPPTTEVIYHLQSGFMPSLVVIRLNFHFPLLTANPSIPVLMTEVSKWCWQKH
uniref:Uncharacterized protein n=1 Tax=Schistocephalus solidus TaxID=70667 RepID=A0A0X3PAQ1_SCHSO